MTEHTIIDTDEIAEMNWPEGQEPGEVGAQIQATEEPTKDRIQFHVQMTGYTLEEMDNLIVEAAARQIVGKRVDSSIAKEIEAKCAEMITRRIDATLTGITAEIIDQPVTPKFGEKQPITMREMIGLVGREYLTEMVDRDGKTKAEKQDSWRFESWGRRIDYIVVQGISKQFRDELQQATREVIQAAQMAANDAYSKVVAEHKEKIAEAFKRIAE